MNRIQLLVAIFSHFYILAQEAQNFTPSDQALVINARKT